MDPDRRALVDRLRERFPEGSPVPGSAHRGAFVEVRESQDEAVLLLRWTKDPHLYGVPIDLTDTTHEFYYDAYDVADDEEWLDSVGVGLTVSFGTGFRARARRRLVDDYIELRAEDGWPEDDRFYLQDGPPTQLAWLVSYENNSTGRRFVGQAVVAEDEGSAGTLLMVEAAPGVPDSVRLDLAYFACHAAAAEGAQAITTALPDEYLDLVGFRPDGDSRRLDTSFLDADPEGARRLRDAG